MLVWSKRQIGTKKRDQNGIFGAICPNSDSMHVRWMVFPTFLNIPITSSPISLHSPSLSSSSSSSSSAPIFRRNHKIVEIAVLLWLDLDASRYLPPLPTRIWKYFKFHSLCVSLIIIFSFHFVVIIRFWYFISVDETCWR